MQLEQVNTVKNDGKSDEKYDENFFFFSYNIYSVLACNYLKSFISAYRALID